ncbi:PREDICTED: uncharacterized protein LOC106147036 [Chinchilla lanigera]|uniref:uncharacterized protein LOC106147036 n=1 Tax=Chinchilla lanigera TaxID=34839 RepID=UPI0006961ADF|nr:PREDICTED: uncharacterized protein LOC106147036 [Chinchilla lanigera]
MPLPLPHNGQGPTLPAAAHRGGPSLGWPSAASGTGRAPPTEPPSAKTTRPRRAHSMHGGLCLPCGPNTCVWGSGRTPAPSRNPLGQMSPTIIVPLPSCLRSPAHFWFRLPHRWEQITLQRRGGRVQQRPSAVTAASPLPGPARSPAAPEDRWDWAPLIGPQPNGAAWTVNQRPTPGLPAQAAPPAAGANILLIFTTAAVLEGNRGGLINVNLHENKLLQRCHHERSSAARFEPLLSPVVPARSCLLASVWPASPPPPGRETATWPRRPGGVCPPTSLGLRCVLPRTLRPGRHGRDGTGLPPAPSRAVHFSASEERLPSKGAGHCLPEAFGKEKTFAASLARCGEADHGTLIWRKQSEAACVCRPLTQYLLGPTTRPERKGRRLCPDEACQRRQERASERAQQFRWALNPSLPAGPAEHPGALTTAALGQAGVQGHRRRLGPILRGSEGSRWGSLSEATTRETPRVKVAPKLSRKAHARVPGTKTQDKTMAYVSRPRNMFPLFKVET